MKRVLFVVSVILVVGLISTATTSAVRSGRPPAGLTAPGRALWNFEALLRETFGGRYRGCLRSVNRYVQTFTKDSYCATHDLAETMYYSFTFAHPSGSTYHLVDRTFPAGAFGNYPEPIRIESAYLACDPAGTEYLISYGDVLGLSANLACIKPNP